MRLFVKARSLVGSRGGKTFVEILNLNFSKCDYRIVNIGLVNIEYRPKEVKTYECLNMGLLALVP